MKRFAAVIVLGMLVLGTAACGRKDDSADTGSSVVEQTESTTGTADTGAGSENVGGAAGDVLEGWSEELSQVREAVVNNLGDEYWPDMQVTPDLFEMNYGISADLYDDYLAEVPMISANVDTLLIVKAKSDKVEDVETALNNYRDTAINDSLQYPMNVGKVQASRIERIGDYVCFVQLGGSAVELGETESVLKQCQEQNELVIEIIRQNLPGGE